MKIIAILSVLLLHLQIIKCQGLERISIKNGQFVDSSGNVKLFHGANYVNKFAPWDPRALREDLTMDKLRDLGLNVVRLGVMWSGVQPTQDFINYTYLDVMASYVERLAQRGIYTIIEFHQDLLSSKFGTYDGVPRWLIDQMPKSRQAFPWPLQQSTINANVFAGLLTEACSYAYQNLYDNTNGFQTRLAEYWSIVSKKFATYTSVLGYELINEPWLGDVYRRPALALSGVAGSLNLMPMYNNLVKVIRENDKNALIFYEPPTGSVLTSNPLLGTGFSSTPNNDPTTSVFSWHFYCGLTEGLTPLLGISPLQIPLLVRAACGLLQAQMTFQAVDVITRKLGGASFLTEFGNCAHGTANGGFDVSQCELVLDRADRYFTSWAYWDLNFFQNENGPPNLDIIKKFSRVYPRSTSGTPVAMSYNAATREFRYEYKPNYAISAPTEIFVPEFYVFTNGFDVTVPDHVSFTYDSTRKRLLLTITKQKSSNVVVRIQARA